MTVFTTDELKTLFGIQNSSHINNIMQVMKKNSLVKNVAKRLRCLNNYNEWELASKIRYPSYISFESVLQKSWIIFQNYQHTITLAASNSLKKEIDGISIEYHKIKTSILTNPVGLNYNWKYYEACPERAICDMVYLYKNTNFDNISNLDLKRLEEISCIYPQKTNLLLSNLIKYAQSE